MSESRCVFVLLPGRKEETDHYQLLQEQAALAAGQRDGLRVETAWAPAFDQLRVLKKRLLEPLPVHAVVFEPSSLSILDILLRELRGRAGLVLLNAWSAAIEKAAQSWDPAFPLGTVSTDHAGIGRIQGEQLLAAASGGSVLCVTGPRRSSAAQERLDALRASVGEAVEILDTEAGEWTEAAGIMAFGDWYRIFKARNPRARLACIDLQPYATTQAKEREDILNIGGFSDQVFEVLFEFAAGRLAESHWIDAIDTVRL